MSISKNSKMLQFINYRMRIVTDDGRTLVGRFIAFDKHMNVVLADCEEFRRARKGAGGAEGGEGDGDGDGAGPKKKERDERRALGLTLLRGECLVSIAVESAPAKKKRSADAAGLGMPGASDRPPMPGAPPPAAAPPPGLAGPAPGLGGASVPPLRPQLAGDARMYPSYGRGAPPPMYGRGAPMHPGAMPPLHGGPLHGGPPPHMAAAQGPPPAYGRGAPGGYGRGGPPPSG